MDKERKRVDTVYICLCGLVMDMADDDDFDTLGADSEICCPDCGNENFKTVAHLQAENKQLKEALKLYGRHGRTDDGIICERQKHSDFPCTCGFEQALKGK